MATSAYKPISDYGIIGDCRSAALVGLDGSIDWCCFPRFDSPSVFAATLDANKSGHFSLKPQVTFTSQQRYVGDTNVLETQFDTGAGRCTVTDCMPLYRRADSSPVELHQIVRALRCEQGIVPMKLSYVPRPDYGRLPVKLRGNGDIVYVADGIGTLSMQSPVNLTVLGDRADPPQARDR